MPLLPSFSIRRDAVRSVRLALSLGLGLLAACDGERVSDPASDAAAWTDSLVWNESAPCPFPSGNWIWQVDSGESAARGETVLLATASAPGRFRWRWSFPAGIEPGRPLLLRPQDTAAWHAFELDSLGSGAPSAIPLPRLPCDSPCFDSLLDLLRPLTGPFFGNVVKHWPQLPVPVRIGQAVCGRVDLSDCLAAAIEIWNRDAGRPWFRIDESADWGVRLVHFPDVRLSPPLEARITRLAEDGAPLRIHIVAGNNYADLRDPKYVVRGFVHELAHALFLWGHSPDRDHCLWGAAPPIVDEPSQDERKAALLWHGLPAGLDLSRYR